jgi:hypothetical protein
MRFRMFVFLFLPAIAFSVAAYADEAAKEHGHKSPHGGVIQEAEGMHAEFLLDKNGEPKLFLYDKAMKPLERSDLEARLTIKGHGGAEHTQALKFSKDAKEGPLFKGEAIKGLTDWDTAVVSVKMRNGWKHIRFSHQDEGRPAGASPFHR